MVPNRLDGKRQLLRTGFRQGTRRHPQARLVSQPAGARAAVIASAEGAGARSILAAASPALSAVAEPARAATIAPVPNGRKNQSNEKKAFHTRFISAVETSA